MIASLGMYDRAETAAANDRLWGLIRGGLRARGVKAPDALTRGEGAYWPAWQSPDLVLSQTCGYPFRARLHDTVTLIGTPDYGVADCPPGHYHSVFVARTDGPNDLATLASQRLAYNEDLSQSGWVGPANHLLSLGLTPRPALRSGGHRASALVVAEGRADLAAIDAVTWAMLQKWDPAVTNLKVVDRTAPTPGLPLIAAKGADRDATFAAVAEAMDRLHLADRALLGLRGLVFIPVADYLAVPTPPPPDHFGLPT
ncbi:MAG: PhnD/SsuA/transferrin family substrate-binding protein [Paracoccaceae bacterium]